MRGVDGRAGRLPRVRRDPLAGPAPYRLAADRRLGHSRRTWSRPRSPRPGRRGSRITRTDDPEVYVRRVLVTTYATWWRRRWRAETPSASCPSRSGPTPTTSPTGGRWSPQRWPALTRGQRAVIVLRYFDDLTEAQTAAALGCSVGTVKSQHARALAALRTSASLAELVGLIDEVTP